LFLGSKLTEKTQIKSMADHVRFNPFLRLWLPDYDLNAPHVVNTTSPRTYELPRTRRSWTQHECHPKKTLAFRQVIVSWEYVT